MCVLVWPTRGRLAFWCRPELPRRVSTCNRAASWCASIRFRHRNRICNLADVRATRTAATWYSWTKTRRIRCGAFAHLRGFSVFIVLYPNNTIQNMKVFCIEICSWQWVQRVLNGTSRPYAGWDMVPKNERILYRTLRMTLQNCLNNRSPGIECLYSRRRLKEWNGCVSKFAIDGGFKAFSIIVSPLQNVYIVDCDVRLVLIESLVAKVCVYMRDACHKRSKSNTLLLELKSWQASLSDWWFMEVLSKW